VEKWATSNPTPHLYPPTPKDFQSLDNFGIHHGLRHGLKRRKVGFIGIFLMTALSPNIKFHVLDRFTHSKSRENVGNEDRLAFSDAYIAVIDGATSKNSQTFNGFSGGAYVARIIEDSLSVIQPGLSGSDLIAEISKIVDNHLAQTSRSERRPSAVAAILSLHAKTITRVGDVGVMINGIGAIPQKTIDQIAANARAAFTRAELARGKIKLDTIKRCDPGRAFILPLLEAQYVFQNNASNIYGYGCIDGSDVPSKFINVTRLSVGEEAVLATDGYPILCRTLTEAEAKLSRSLRDDPMRIDNDLGTKGYDPETQASYDDRTYLRIVLEN
jgi:hypothetical protein